jgi:hypothetical protein
MDTTVLAKDALMQPCQHTIRKMQKTLFFGQSMPFVIESNVLPNSNSAASL